MAKGLTPLIGLAVVVALAMVAVFGAMSLTNPAFAAVGEPADAELAERTFSPQVDKTVMTYAGESVLVDITDLIPGGGANFDSLVTAATTVEPSGLIDTNDGVTANTELFGSIRLAWTAGVAADADAAIDGRIYVTLKLKEGDNKRLRLDVDLGPATPPDEVGEIDDLSVYLGPADTDADAEGNQQGAGKLVSIDVSDNFKDGRGPAGTAKITAYAVVIDGVIPSDTASVERVDKDGTSISNNTDNSTDGMIYLRATDIAEKGHLARVTVTTVPLGGTQSFFVDVGGAGTGATGGDVSFKSLSDDPGKNTRYELKFPAPKDMNTLTDEIVIELEDFNVPSSIDEDSIAVTVTMGCDVANANPAMDKDCTTTPQDIAVSGEKIFITVGDLDKASDDTANDFSIQMDEVIAVVIRQSAGIRNPTEAGDYGPVAYVLLGNNDKLPVAKFDGDKDLTIPVPRILSLDEEDGGLGTVVNATGKGFKNGTTLTVFVDKPVHMDDDKDPTTPMSDDDGVLGVDMMMPNRKLDLGEDTLCEVSQIGGDDVGTCEFTVTHPTFSGGINYINAVDGRNGYVDVNKDLGEFELTASISASPAGGSPGEIILIQMVDFPVGPVVKVQLSRTEVCGPASTTPTCNGSVDLTGSGNFKIIIPNWAKSGSQELRVTGQNDAAGDPVKGAKNVVISGPQIQVTPGSVVANQRISLVGVGFSSGAHITRVAPGIPQISKMSVGGKDISWARINGGQPVEVDSGGNWSAAVDLPLHEATTAEGDRTIRITDSGGRTGSVTVVIAAREVTITPATGRVGTLATVRGMNFPSKNDDGSSFNVAVVYDAGNDKQTTVSAVPDASGRFEVQLRIPTTASIPSTNTVKVQFDDDDDVTVVTTVTHEVPEGAINLSQTSGSPGSTISISGVGFKSFVPVKSVMVGSLEVTPSPRPSTDSQGMMSFKITIPGLDVGIQTIEVKVGGTTASVGFTVTTSGVAAGNITESSLAVVNLGENFERSFNFNNDTKSWTFYSPEAPDDSTQTSFITGESYWILIEESQEVILNGKTRNLTCGAGNCWNQIVW